MRAFEAACVAFACPETRAAAEAALLVRPLRPNAAFTPRSLGICFLLHLLHCFDSCVENLTI